MRASVYTLMSAVLLLAMTGCVSQSQGDRLKEANRTLAERLAECQANCDELTERIARIRSERGVSDSELAALTAERDSLLTENKDLRTKIRGFRPGPVLPPELEDELKKFADAHGAIAVYDEETGSVRLASDLTFGLGSAELSSAAQAAVPKLAGILNGELAKNYEVRIVGHTDAMPITRTATRQKHGTNWGLSVHRAIAVRDALAKAGVADVRTSVSGYGKYRPVVQNAARGAKDNRRVEVYLVPMAPVDESLIKRTGTSPAPTGGGAPAQPEPDRGPIILK